MSNENGITCQLCSTQTHVIESHLRKSHPEITLDEYRERFPMAPILSGKAEDLLRKRAAEKAALDVSATPDSGSDATVKSEGAVTAAEFFLHDVFGFGDAQAARNAKREPIKIKCFEGANDVPDKDPAYIFDINLTKTVVMALEMNVPLYLWGHAGTGKTSLIDQVCACTGRSYTRIQHTANTEEADIEGYWKVEDGATKFVLGPLPTAMINGEVYCADEYDFANPQVLAIYQAVLEGKPLRIKSANLTIRAHPNFRFTATGNTNGAGDDTGLYMGTQIQNAANYERFGIVCKVEYMPRHQEIGILRSRFSVEESVAQKLVEFASQMRSAFENREVAIPMSPRSLQYATRLGIARNDYKWGIENAYVNRLPGTSAEFAKQIMQRHFA